MRTPTWLPRTFLHLFTLLVILAGACATETPGGAIELIFAADATVEPPEETCDIHPPEEMSDDGCCGCHYWGSPHECLADCGPDPEPTTETETEVGVLEHANTYYRIGGGVEPGAGEYEYVAGQSGENGKIKKGGGTSKGGVSVFSTEADAMAARTRIGSTGKIHKISSFPKDVEFISKQPPPNHFHIVPAKDMPLADFKAALKKVKLTKVEP